jgi:hypothetical protein
MFRPVFGFWISQTIPNWFTNEELVAVRSERLVLIPIRELSKNRASRINAKNPFLAARLGKYQPR